MSKYGLALPSSVSAYETLRDLLASGQLAREHSVVVCDARVLEHNKGLRMMLAKQPGVQAVMELDHPEPYARYIEDMAVRARSFQPGAIISIGGGSTIDAAKGIAHLVPCPRRLPNTFETPGHFSQVLHHVCIPTTAGPGAESSPAMVYRVAGHRAMAIVDARLIPSEVVFVYELPAGMTSFQTACSAMDGVSHAIETAVSSRTTVTSRVMSVTALRTFIRWLPVAIASRVDLRAWEGLYYAGFLSSQALQIAGATAVHALAGPLAAYAELPHGAAVSLCLCAVLADDIKYFAASGGGLAQLADDCGFGDAENLLALLSQIVEQHVRTGLQAVPPLAVSALDDLGSDALHDERLRRHPTPFDSSRIHRIYANLFETLDGQAVSRRQAAANNTPRSH